MEVLVLYQCICPLCVILCSLQATCKPSASIARACATKFTANCASKQRRTRTCAFYCRFGVQCCVCILFFILGLLFLHAQSLLFVYSNIQWIFCVFNCLENMYIICWSGLMLQYGTRKRWRNKRFCWLRSHQLVLANTPERLQNWSALQAYLYLAVFLYHVGCGSLYLERRDRDRNHVFPSLSTMREKKMSWSSEVRAKTSHTYEEGTIIACMSISKSFSTFAMR